MGHILHFVRTFPGWTISVIVALVVILPIAWEVIDFILRLQAHLGR